MDNDMSCKQCPEGTTCVDGATLATLQLEPGYFRFNRDSSQIYECKGKNRNCDGGKHVETQCAAASKGPLCAKCEPGHTMVYTGRCEACGDAQTSKFFETGGWLVIVFFTFVAGFLYTRDKCTEGTARRYMGASLFYQWFTKDEKRKGILNFLSFGAIIIGINMLLFLPFLSSDLLDKYLSSVGLWFQKFEFNASLYYIARALGTLFRGYNEIAIIGKTTPVIVVIFLLIITLFRKNKSPQQLITALLIGISFYYFTTTTMHPWYLTTLVILSVFTNYRFPIVWSVVIVLSYQAYANIPWKENLWLIALEYLVVYGFLLWEILQIKKKSLAIK